MNKFNGTLMVLMLEIYIFKEIWLFNVRKNIWDFKRVYFDTGCLQKAWWKDERAGQLWIVVSLFGEGPKAVNRVGVVVANWLVEKGVVVERYSDRAVKVIWLSLGMLFGK